MNPQFLVPALPLSVVDHSLTNVYAYLQSAILDALKHSKAIDDRKMLVRCDSLPCHSRD